MGHRITIVDDEALPEGHDFVLVSLPAGVHIFYRRSTLDVEPLEDSWTAFRAIAHRHPSSPTRATSPPCKVLDIDRRAG